jgi:sugar phosphate permease
LNYGGTVVSISSHVKVCSSSLSWGSWNAALIPGGWTVCTLSQWAAYAPAGSPSSYGLDTIWINNSNCGSGQHHEVYVSYPMNQAACYDGGNCCWSDGTSLRFAVCL